MADSAEIDLARVYERVAARGGEDTHYPGCEELNKHVWCLVKRLADEVGRLREKVAEMEAKG